MFQLNKSQVGGKMHFRYNCVRSLLSVTQWRKLGIIYDNRKNEGNGFSTVTVHLLKKQEFSVSPAFFLLICVISDQHLGYHSTKAKQKDLVTLFFFQRSGSCFVFPSLVRGRIYGKGTGQQFKAWHHAVQQTKRKKVLPQ